MLFCQSLDTNLTVNQCAIRVVEVSETYQWNCVGKRSHTNDAFPLFGVNEERHVEFTLWMQGSLLYFCRNPAFTGCCISSFARTANPMRWDGTYVTYVWIFWAKHNNYLQNPEKISDDFSSEQAIWMTCGVTATARLKRLGFFEPNYLVTARGPKKKVGNSFCRFIMNPPIDGWCRVRHVDGINDRAKSVLVEKKGERHTWSYLVNTIVWLPRPILQLGWARSRSLELRAWDWLGFPESLPESAPFWKWETCLSSGIEVIWMCVRLFKWWLVL